MELKPIGHGKYLIMKGAAGKKKTSKLAHKNKQKREKERLNKEAELKRLAKIEFKAKKRERAI
jgi:hypothetical protein